jgi:hypothetical protein
MTKPQIDTNDAKVQEAAAVLVEPLESGDQKAIKAVMRQFGLAAVKWAIGVVAVMAVLLTRLSGGL